MSKATDKTWRKKQDRRDREELVRIEQERSEPSPRILEPSKQSERYKGVIWKSEEKDG